jgi:hypothetical protein
MHETAIKPMLLAYCHTFADHRIASARQAMNDAQQSANQEEKSSAGDKYETGRAMMQLERDKAARQLDEGLKLKQILSQITDLRVDRAGLGSLVITKSKFIFLAIGIGKVKLDDVEYLIIAPQSPLGKVVANRSVDETFVFNGESDIISKIL